MRRLLSIAVLMFLGLGCGTFPFRDSECCCESEARYAKKRRYVWIDQVGSYLELLVFGKPVVRYFYEFDNSSEQRFFETGKPYLAVYDPPNDVVLTNRLGVLYPHHRGIFIGWNKTGYQGKSADFWHMKGGAQMHQRFLEFTCTKNDASVTALIHWNDLEGTTVISEARTMSIQVPSEGSDVFPLSIDFKSVLTAPTCDVELDGDPEHAGVHFRAHQEVAERAEQIAKRAKEARDQKREPEADPDATVYQFHAPDINPREDTDLPWVSMAFTVGGHRYVVTQENHPDNPKPTLYSAYRDYGRFGAFFRATVKQGESLTVQYRFRIERQDSM